MLNNILEHKKFLEIPSISIENRGISDSVSYLYKLFESIQADSIDIYSDFSDFPIIVAKFNGTSDKTILIYNHYDVQPIGNIDEWKTSPFEPTVIDDKIYCRGISDCKGEILSRVFAINELKKKNKLNYNITFIIEGEEEIGSPSLEKYLNYYKDELQADICLWECGWKNECEQLEICCGVKGILNFDLYVSTANFPIHSSFSNIIPNAAQRISEALSTMIDSKHHILIPGIYNDIINLDNQTLLAFQKLNTDFTLFYETNGIKNTYIPNIIESLYNKPTLNISNITAGESNNINSTPSIAKASIDCRFLPNQNPQNILYLIRKHLDKNNFKDIQIKNSHYEDAYRSDLSSKEIQLALNTIYRHYGKDNVQIIPNFAGGGPMHLFGNILKVPIISLGISYSRSNVHAPNENIRISDFIQNKNCLVDWFSNN